MADIFDMADTWNAGGTTFTAIKMNVTDTASAAASLLMDLQVGGASKFKVTKDGATTGQAFYFNDQPTRGFALASGHPAIDNAGVILAQFHRSNSIDGHVKATGPKGIGWATGPSTAPADVYLQRDGANLLGMRNGTAAQGARIYNTYTDASNYERLGVSWSANVVSIKPEAAGTGAVRPLHISGLPTSDPAIAGVLWNDAGTVKASAG